MFSGRDCVSIKDFAKEEILHILELAREMKATPPGPLLEGKLIASCFFEPSTRTRLSFEAAAKRLGASVITCADKESTSLKKGETLSDTIRVIDSYTDLVILRHPLEGAARLAAEVSDKPVINGGDGANEHPTQTLLDLFTILECHKKLEGLHIAFVGDLKYSRTYSSLALALRHFGARLYFVSPPALPVKEGLIRELQVSGTTFSCHETEDHPFYVPRHLHTVFLHHFIVLDDVDRSRRRKDRNFSGLLRC